MTLSLQWRRGASQIIPGGVFSEEALLRYISGQVSPPAAAARVPGGVVTQVIESERDRERTKK